MTTTHARRMIAALGLAAIVGLAPARACTQTLELRITPKAGAVTPADWFYEEFAHFGADPLEWTEAALQEAPVVGISAEIAVLDDALWIRGEVLRTIGQNVSVTHAYLQPPGGYEPARVIRTPFLLDAALTIGTLDLAFPTRFRLPLGLQPYVTAGVGGKRYDFDVSDIAAYDDQMVLPQEGVTWVLNVGAGATARILGLNLDFLVRDAVSEYWEKQQHDVTLLLGVTVPLLRIP